MWDKARSCGRGPSRTAEKAEPEKGSSFRHWDRQTVLADRRGELTVAPGDQTAAGEVIRLAGSNSRNEWATGRRAYGMEVPVRVPRRKIPHTLQGEEGVQWATCVRGEGPCEFPRRKVPFDITQNWGVKNISSGASKTTTVVERGDSPRF